MKFLKIYRIPKNDWDDAYEDGLYDLMVIDEYRGWKSIEYLNSIAEGAPMALLRRGMADIMKTDRLPLIICSNLSIAEAYGHLDSNAIELIQARFCECFLDIGNVRIDFEGCKFEDL